MTEIHPGGLETVAAAAEPTPADVVRVRRQVPISVFVAVGWLALVLLVAVLADVLPLSDPDADTGFGARVAPFQSWSEPLGTDAFGRSMLSRVIYGARLSLTAGLAAAAIAFLVGLVMGITSGYFRGKVDTAVGLLVDTVLAFPGLVLLLALSSVLPRGVTATVFGLAVLATPAFVRLARASALRIATAEFVMAARGLGARPHMILRRQLLPNVAVTLIPYAGVVMATLTIAAASLSFLGLGVPPPTASWGLMIAEGRTDMREAPAVVLIPVVALSLTILALNRVGEWLRTRSDPGSKL